MSPVDRLAMLREFVQGKPDDPFPRYGLAMELKNQGQLEEAQREFATLVAKFPDYTPAYLHAGNVLVALGRKSEAISVWKTGIDACVRKRDAHAQGEIQAALVELEASPSSTSQEDP
jgi:predicted Zn-dependent protease